MEVNDNLYDYCIEYSEKEAGYLRNLRRDTYLKTTRPQMLSGPLQGQFLRMIVQLLQPKSILEIGTFTGYATLLMASALVEGGKVYTVEKEEELSYFHNKYFPQSGFQKRIEVIYADANRFLRKTELRFDLVFMDAGKKDYKDQFELLISKMLPGGCILADNVLWKGKVLDADHDRMTAQIHSFNQYVANDSRVENIILPIRDGINLIRIKS